MLYWLDLPTVLLVIIMLALIAAELQHLKQYWCAKIIILLIVALAATGLYANYRTHQLRKYGGFISSAIRTITMRELLEPL